MGCPGSPDAPPPDALREPETAIIALATADSAAFPGLEVIDAVVKEAVVTATEVSEVDVVHDAAEAEVQDGVADAVGLASTIAVVDGRLSWVGLPGVSADGMHLALLDVARGRVAIDVVRLDGKVLVEKVLREASEHDAEPDKLMRRYKARIAQAHKVLAKAGMHALIGTTVEVRGADFVVQVPGAKPVTLGRATLDRPCGRATGIDAAFIDREHQLVVVSVVRDGDCATDEARNDWHVVTLESAPAAEVP